MLNYGPANGIRDLMAAFQVKSRTGRKRCRCGKTGQDILCDEVDGEAAVVNKSDAVCTAAEGLKPECTGAGEKVEDHRLFNMVAYDVEQGFSGTVRGRSDSSSLAWRRRKSPASSRSADYSQVY